LNSFLNNLVIADSDLIYTHTLTGINRDVDYKNKEVLILGGGDGGTLYELLNLGDNKPLFIWMAEIDEDVVKACRDHLKKVCFNALDSYEGPNYKVNHLTRKHFLTWYLKLFSFKDFIRKLFGYSKTI
jgi:spermine synthase